MRVEDLSNLKVEFLVARILGHQVNRRNRPYCVVDDWNKPGSLVTDRFFEPTVFEAQAKPIIRHYRIKTRKTKKGWGARMHVISPTDPSKRVWIGHVLYHNTRIEAAMRCVVKAHYPNMIPLELLVDSSILATLVPPMERHREMLKILAI